MRTLVWFREDLRIEDNPALYHAAKTATDSVLAVFFIAPKLWKQKGFGEKKIDFILRTVIQLASSLEKKNISLKIEFTNTQSEIQKKLLKLSKQHHLDSVYFNKTIGADREERSLMAFLERSDRKVFAFDNETILLPGSVLTQKEAFYTVYTPFKNQWIKVFKDQKNIAHYQAPSKQQKKISKTDLSLINKYFKQKNESQKQWPAGEKEANRRLRKFIKNNITEYSKRRDFPVLNGTSMLSAYLAVGAISIRKCLLAAMKANKNKIDEGNQDILSWINELIWRDFYKHLLVGFPYIIQKKPFKNYGSNIKWSNDRRLFNAWKKGQTGYPIIDAAMRQLNQTGWMHNRLRMIVASFLSKILLIDWRLGEKYFAEKLIDYDFSANNGGWQWAASTGADAMPYFRIFNPMLQSQKYDADGKFIRTFCPEYRKLNLKEIHLPQTNAIVQYQSAKNCAIKTYKKAYA